MQVLTVEGDLLEQDVDAIVNAWNRNVIPWWLLIPQGVSGAIKRRGGYGPFWELGWRAMPLGSARHTTAGRLPFKGIVHVAGIDMLWRASTETVAMCARAATVVAVERGYESLAFPVIGAGTGGLPEIEAERVLVETLTQIEAPLRAVVVRFRAR